MKGTNTDYSQDPAIGMIAFANESCSYCWSVPFIVHEMTFYAHLSAE